MKESERPTLRKVKRSQVVAMLNYCNAGESLTGRPLIASDEEFSFGFNAGVINANGESWLENRLVFLIVLTEHYFMCF